MIQIITTITQHGKQIEYVTDAISHDHDPATPNELKLATAAMHAVIKALSDNSVPESNEVSIVEFDNPQIVEQ